MFSLTQLGGSCGRTADSWIGGVGGSFGSLPMKPDTSVSITVEVTCCKELRMHAIVYLSS